MLNRILAACLAAGVLAGMSAAVLQHFTTTPLILAAEAYETGGEAEPHQGATMDGAGGARLIPAGGHDHAHSMAGLWLALRVSSPWAIGAGVVLIVLPHLIGAPHPHVLTSKVPAELAGHFASASLVVQALIWALVGATAGYVWQRTGRQAAA